ncbi:MAG TPA: PepSY domain-containing protein [Gallionella sp.]
MKRLLFEVHRWVGVVLALFMLLWFFSGLVIIYAEPTTPTRAQQLAHAESLKVEAGWLSAGDAWERSAAQRNAQASNIKDKLAEGKNTANTGSPKSGSGVQNQIVEARLLVEAAEPLWLIEDSKGQRYAVSAVDGALHKTTSEQALKIAEKWVSSDSISAAVSVRFVETIDNPAILRNQEALRPFHRISVDDDAGSELLISARTGEVVSATTRINRGFYWAGNWVHLFRPLELTGVSESRVDVLTWTSFAVIVATLTGLIVGWLRWRPGLFGKKTYSEGRVHPYRNFWFKWHFWGGLIGGVLALSWGLSGFLNNNPWKLFSPANPSKEELVRYVGGDDLSLPRSWRAGSVTSVDADVVELGWRRLGDETVQLAYTRDGRRLLRTINGTAPRFSDATIQAAVHRLAGDVPVVTQTLLQEYDSYYYLRFHRDVADRPLPVVRVELNDAVGTHLYIDPQDGRLLAKQDRSRRVFRWLYSALHHWDFGWLYQHPLWDGWMLTWVLLGLVLSVSAVVIGWKRLEITFRPKRHSVREEEGLQVAEPSTLATENQAG